MSDDKNRFEPMYNIPSMEELDRQWRESQENSKRAKSGAGQRSTAGRSNMGRSQNVAAQRNRSTTQRSTGQRPGNTTGRSAAGQRPGNTAGRSAAGQRPGNTAGRSAAGQRPGNAAGRKGKSATADNKPGIAEAAAGKGKKRGKKEKKPKKFRKFRLFLKIFLLLLLLAVLGGLVAFYFKFGDDLLRWKKEAKQLVEESNRNTFRSSETSFIYAANKKPIAKLRGDKDTDYINFADIPQEAIDCMVVTEDRDFYEHSGVNFLSTAKAGFLYVKGKLMGDDSITRGGSTITQQLAKNVFLSNEQTEERKIREMFIAIEMERKYTKDEIMEFYLNNICFANGHFGIEAASKAYFSKSVKELNLPEIAFLCAIPNIPTYYDPLRHFDHTQSRKERILNQLLETGKIEAAEYSDAVYENIELKPAEAIKTQDYMTTYAISCATKELMKKKGFEFRYEFASDEDEKIGRASCRERV